MKIVKKVCFLGQWYYKNDGNVSFTVQDVLLCVYVFGVLVSAVNATLSEGMWQVTNGYKIIENKNKP